MASALDTGSDSLDAKVAAYMNLYGNCAQASFDALRERIGLECDAPAFLRALRPFPGMGLTQETCGGVSGCLFALGLRYGTADPRDRDASATCMQLANRFCATARRELGSTRCGDILERRLGKRIDFLDSSQTGQYFNLGGAQTCTEVVQALVRIAARLIDEPARFRGRVARRP